MALANYTASAQNEKTAYLELNGHGQMANWHQINRNGFFEEQKIHFYPDVKKEQIPILFNYGYDNLIMDFGDRYLSFREELLRCDRKAVLLNLNPWQKFAAEKALHEMRQKNWGSMQPIYAGVNVQKAVKEAIQKEYGIAIIEIPNIPNPRRIRRDEFSYMELILGCPAVKVKRRKSLIPIIRKR